MACKVAHHIIKGKVYQPMAATKFESVIIDDLAIPSFLLVPKLKHLTYFIYIYIFMSVLLVWVDKI